MSTTFFVDPSSIPLFQDPAGREALIKLLTEKVTSELQVTFGVSAAQADVGTVPSAAAVLGMLLLDGEADSRSGSLASSHWSVAASVQSRRRVLSSTTSIRRPVCFT